MTAAKRHGLSLRRAPRVHIRMWPEPGCRVGALAAGLLLVVCVWLGLCGVAWGVTRGVGWGVSVVPYPTSLPRGGGGLLRVAVFDTGAVGSSSGATLTDVLPLNFTAVSGEGWECSGSAPEACTRSVPAIPAGASGEQGVFFLPVSVGAGAAGTEVGEVTVAGGGAVAAASAREAIAVGGGPAGFGLTNWEGWFSNVDGAPDTQAGSHPYEAVFGFTFNTNSNGGEIVKAGNQVRDIEVELPPGVVADPNAAPQCTRAQFDEPIGEPECPAASQIGIAELQLGGASTPSPFEASIYNLVPPPGIPAQFGLAIDDISAFIDGSVRTGGGYSLVGDTNDIPQRKIISGVITLWGDPADPSHDRQRCAIIAGKGACGLRSEAQPEPFLTLPTSCEGELTTTIHASAWHYLGAPPEEATASFPSLNLDGVPAGMSGCEDLAFGPSISIAPDTGAADTPAGLTADVRVPQEGLATTEGLSEADLKDTTVTLPEGMAINPGQAAGLAACQQAESAVGSEAAPSCPAASKVGTVKVRTPLLEGAAEKELEGNVYVLQSNPPNLRLLAAPSGDGVNLKLVGEAHLNEQTGQIVTSFQDTPQLPFTDFKLSFSGGAQAALSTPTRCGTYASTTQFTPWSTPFTTQLAESSSFQVTSGTGGGACPSSPLAFTPSLSAGSTTDQAGAFTDFSLLLQAPDDQQRIGSLQFKAPDGPLRGPQRRAAVPRRTGAGRHVPGGLADRARDRRLRPGPLPAGDPPAREPRPSGLPHGPLRRRAVRAIDRDARDRGPV